MRHASLADTPLADLPEAALATARDAAEAAGAIALAAFRPGLQADTKVWAKAGGSPVTEADIAVDTFLKTHLSASLPQAGWLSEETADDPARLSRPLVWIVDPIDGTRAFMAGHPDWSVAIALLIGNEPVAGIVHAPALGVTYTAMRGGGAFQNDEAIHVSARAALAGARAAGPRFALEALAGEVPIQAMPRVPSLALRLTRIADASIEAALVTADARDWDIAAADLILTEAGGRLTNLAAETPLYNRPIPVHGALVAAGQPLHGDLVAAARRIEALGALART